MTGHATTDMALHCFHENEDGLKKTVAMIPAIGGASTPAKPAEGEFDAFLNGLDRAALKRLERFPHRDRIMGIIDEEVY